MANVEIVLATEDSNLPPIYFIIITLYLKTTETSTNATENVELTPAHKYSLLDYVI